MLFSKLNLTSCFCSGIVRCLKGLTVQWRAQEEEFQKQNLQLPVEIKKQMFPFEVRIFTKQFENLKIYPLYLNIRMGTCVCWKPNLISFFFFSVRLWCNSLAINIDKNFICSFQNVFFDCLILYQHVIRIPEVLNLQCHWGILLIFDIFLT